MMSSNPLKKKEVLFWGTYQFYTNSEKYDWTSGEWEDIDNSLQHSYHKALPMVGYGLTEKLAMYAQFPMSYFIQPEENTFYFDDIVLMSRYAIIPSSGTKSGLTLLGAVRLPTGKTGDNKNFSDGSIDFAIGEIYSTKWYSNWRTHIKSNYIFNTKNATDERMGNEVAIFLKQDYKLGDVKICLVNQYSHQFNKRNAEGEMVENSYKTRISHTFLVEYKLKNGLTLKPKFQIPGYAKGGSNSDFKFIFEVYYRI